MQALRQGALDHQARCEVYQIRSAVADPLRAGRGQTANEEVTQATFAIAGQLVSAGPDPNSLRGPMRLLAERDAARELGPPDGGCGLAMQFDWAQQQLTPTSEERTHRWPRADGGPGRAPRGP